MRAPVIGILTCLSLGQAAAADVTTLSVEGGSASFSVGTNAIGLSITGKSDALRASVEMRRAANDVVLDRVAASLPVKTLVTGMSMRDSHMRKHVFDKPNGESEDLRFEAEGISCAGLALGKETVCPVSGKLAIRGIPRQFATTLKVRQESAGVFRIRGDGTVRLSDYGIEQPSQLGIKTENEVQVRLDFTARPAVSASVRGAPAR